MCVGGGGGDVCIPHYVQMRLISTLVILYHCTLPPVYQAIDMHRYRIAIDIGRPVDPPNYQIKFLTNFSGYMVYMYV